MIRFKDGKVDRSNDMLANELADALDAANEEVERFRLDAERYRFVSNRRGDIDIGICRDGDWGTVLNAGELDRFVDQRIAEPLPQAIARATALTDDLEARAREFATRYHAGQVRKYTGEPYINHPAAVVELVRSVPHAPEMLAAAWLHDTLEDTKAKPSDLLHEFGPDVTILVMCLTDKSTGQDGNRAQRKAIDREHIAEAPAAAKTVKLADLIDNSRSIVARDPGFAKTYLAEKRLLLEVLRDGDPTLWRMAYEIAHA